MIAALSLFIKSLMGYGLNREMTSLFFLSRQSDGSSCFACLSVCGFLSLNDELLID